MEYPHWLMVAGAVLVVVGFIGFAFQKNDAEPADDDLKQEAAPPDEQNPPWLDRRRSAGGEKETLGLPSTDGAHPGASRVNR